MVGEAVVLSAILFVIGTFGVLVRRNAIIMFLCIELQLNAVNLSFVAFSRLHGIDGQIFVFFVMTVAAALCRAPGDRPIRMLVPRVEPSPVECAVLESGHAGARVGVAHGGEPQDQLGAIRTGPRHLRLGLGTE